MVLFSAINDEIGNTLIEQLKCLTKNKVKFIEFRKINNRFLFELNELEINTILQLLKQNNISVSMIDTPIGKSKYQFSEKDIYLIFGKYIKIAKMFNTNKLRVFSDIADDILFRLCKIAQKNGIDLFMENEKGTQFTSFDYFINLKNKIKMNNLFVLYDVENYFLCNGKEKYLDDFNKYSNIVKYIHLRDYDDNYTIITKGKLDIVNIIDQMSKKPFEIYISLESHLPMISSKDKKELFSENMEEIRKKICKG